MASGRQSFGRLKVKSDRSSISKPGLKGRASSIGFGSSSIKKQGALSLLGLSGSSSSVSRARRRMTTGGEPMRDPRPVPNKGPLRDESINLLLSVLTKYEYSYHITPKMLQSPKAADISQIFQFLYNLIDPDYIAEEKRKVEDVIPVLVKNLGYPFLIKRSSLRSVGSPHVWPNVLAMLTWMCTSIETLFGEDADDLLFPPPELQGAAENESKTKLKYYEETYNRYMGGDDTFHELDDAVMRKMTMSVTGDLDPSDLEMRCRELQSSLHILEAEPDQFLELKGKLIAVNEDAAKLENFTSSLEQFVAKDGGQASVLEEENVELENELTALKADIERKRGMLNTQTLSQQDVERINQKRSDLKRQTANVASDVQNINQEIWDHEMSVTKLRESAEGVCEEFNKIALGLDMYAASVNNPYGIDFHLTADTTYPLSTENIKPALEQILMKCKTEVRGLAENKRAGAETLEQLNEQLTEGQDSIGQQEEIGKKIDAAMTQKKEQLQSDIHDASSQLEQLRKDNVDLRSPISTPTSGAGNLKQQLKTHEAKFYSLKEKEEKDLKGMQDLLLFAMDTVLNHKAEIQEAVRQSTTHIQETYKNSFKKKPDSTTG